MNIFKNLLVIFGNDCKIQVLGLEGGKDSSNFFNSCNKNALDFVY